VHTPHQRWSDNVFISGGNPHLTNRCYGVVLGSTTIFKMVSESSPRFDRPSTIRFPLSGHPPFMSTFHMSNPDVRGCVKKSHMKGCL